MKNAILYKLNKLVSADDVKKGYFSRNEDFIDPESEFRVIFVKSAKNNGSAYFRLYLSLKDYNKLSNEKKKKYDFLKELYHFKDSRWHNGWKDKIKSFAELEN